MALRSVEQLPLLPEPPSHLPKELFKVHVRGPHLRGHWPMLLGRACREGDLSKGTPVAPLSHSTVNDRSLQNQRGS